MGFDSNGEMQLVSRGKLELRTLIRSAIGIVGLIALGWFLLGEVAQRFTWLPTACSIESARLESSKEQFTYSSGGDDHGNGGTQHAIDYESQTPRVTFLYTADGQTYRCESQDILHPSGDCVVQQLEAEKVPKNRTRAAAPQADGGDLLGRFLAIPPKFNEDAAAAILSRFQPGTTADCWYEAGPRHQAVLLRRIEWFHIAVALLLGLGIVAFLADLYVASRPSYRVEPVLGVPLGERGAKPARGSRGLGYLAMLGIVIFISGFVYLVAFMWLIGDVPIMITLAVSPFALLGLVLLLSALYDLMTFRIGPVSAEVDGAGVPGGRVKLRIVQHGPARLGSLRVRLFGEETVRSKRQSHGRTQSFEKTVARHKETLFEARGVRVGAGRYADKVIEVEVPQEVSDTRLQWRIVVSRRARLLPLINLNFNFPIG